MGVLTNGQLGKLRRAVQRLFDQTATIYAKPEPGLEDKGQDPDAIYPDDWTATTEPCLFYASQRVPSEVLAAGQNQSRGEFQIVFKWNVARPAESSKIRLNGLDYEIAGISDSSYLVALIIDLVRMK